MGMAVSAEILRRALNDPEAKESAGLTRMQADAILAMQLQRLDRPGGRQAGAGIPRPEGRHRRLRADPRPTRG